MPTSKATRAGSKWISSDKQSSAFDARISFVKSTCSHQRSSAFSIDIVLPSSGVSMFIRQTDDGTSTDNNHTKYAVNVQWVLFHCCCCFLRTSSQILTETGHPTWQYTLTGHFSRSSTPETNRIITNARQKIFSQKRTSNCSRVHSTRDMLCELKSCQLLHKCTRNSIFKGLR